MSEPEDKTNPDKPHQKVCSVLFVCTGNTCRSPLAEALGKRMLADRLKCEIGQLPSRGFEVRSAGVAAWPGDPASLPAEEVAQEYGADLTQHQSRPVNPELLENATHVVAMTRGHAMALLMRFPEVESKLSLLCGPDQDLPDPIGGDLELYRACAETIRGHLERFVPLWLGIPDRM